MTQEKAKQKQTRNQRRRERRRQHHVTPKERMDVSTQALDHFEEMMDPTARDIAEVKYEHIIADPAGAELVGVPMALGGVPPTSVKVRMRLAKTMISSNTGEIAIAFYNCSGPPDSSSYATFDDVEALTKSLGNTLPKWGRFGAAPTTIDLYRPPLVVGGYFGSGIPALGDSNATPLVDSNSLTVPDPGLSLRPGVGRLVAQEVEIYPVGPMLTTKGLGYTVILNETASSALNGRTPQDAYQLQNTQRHSFPLANWDPDHVIRAVRVPMAQTDVNLLSTDYTNYQDEPGYYTKYNYLKAGEVWGAFFGTGLEPAQAFRVETTLVYEFVASQYAFATANNAVTGNGTELLTGIKEALPAGVYSQAHLPANKAGAVAHAMTEQHGPKHAAGFASFLKKVGGGIGKVAEEVLPKLLGAALTAGTEGMLPPQVGDMLGREAFTLVNGFSGAPVQSLGVAPMVSPPRMPQLEPQREPKIEEVDFALVQNENPTQKGAGIPPLPPSPECNIANCANCHSCGNAE